MLGDYYISRAQWKEAVRSIIVRRNRMTRIPFIIALALVISAASWGGQSLVLNHGGNQSLSIPGFSKSDSWRIEFQLHGWNDSETDSNFAELTGGIVRQFGGDRWYFAPQQDSYPGGTPCIFTMTGRSNVLIRIQRDYSVPQWTCEMWDTNGSNYSIQRRAILSANNDTGSGGYIRGQNSNLSFGFLRVSSKLKPLNSRPPVTAETGDVLELKFDGNGSDSSGRGRDMSTSGFTFQETPGQEVFAIPATPNTPSWAPFVPLRAGYPSKLSSHSYSMADASADVTCYWVQTDGPSHAIFDDRSSCTPTLTGLVFGPYTFRLIATDSAGTRAEADIDIGAVAYDDNGVVIYPDERLNSLLGPSMVLGKNPWEWADSQSVKMAVKNWDNYKINGGTWDAEWLLPSVNGIPRNGTVYKPSGTGLKLYGIGTNFKDVFCGGEVGPVAKPIYVVVDQVPADPDDEPNRYARYVASCESDTELTFVSGWIWERPFIDAPGVSWGTVGACSDCSTWNGRNYSSDVNYYGNDLAHYALYYRSGWKKARDSARWMADRYAYSPWIAGGVGWIPRNAALTAAFLRSAIDTEDPPAKNVWPLLRRMVDTQCSGLASSAAVIGDPRESAYCLAFTAMKAKYDPDPAERAESLDILVAGYANRWGSQQKADGSYVNRGATEGDTSRVHYLSRGSSTVTRHSGAAYPSDYCGTVFSTAGSIAINGTDRVSVTGTGTNFVGSAGKVIFMTGTLDGQPWTMASTIAATPAPTATSMTLAYPWRGDTSTITKYKIMDAKPPGRSYWTMFMGEVTSANVLTGPIDTDNWYDCTYVNGDTLTLDKPYTGNTSGGNNYRRMTWQNLTGSGTQPFIMGIIGWAEYLVADALDDYNPTVASDYRATAGKTVDWIWQYGRNPTTKGLRYGVGYSNCKSPDFSPAFECWSSSSNYERSYNIETIGAFARKYLATRSSEDLTIGDALYTDTYAKTGYASPFLSDGHWSDAVEDGSYGFSVTLQTKNYGQAWGVGGGQVWPAARLGGRAKPIPRDVSVGFLLSSVQGAASVQVRTIGPSGRERTTICHDTSPCHLTLDSRMGSYWMQLEYLSNSGAVLAVSERQLIQVR